MMFILFALYKTKSLLLSKLLLSRFVIPHFKIWSKHVNKKKTKQMWQKNATKRERTARRIFSGIGSIGILQKTKTKLKFKSEEIGFFFRKINKYWTLIEIYAKKLLRNFRNFRSSFYLIFTVLTDEIKIHTFYWIIFISKEIKSIF